MTDPAGASLNFVGGGASATLLLQRRARSTIADAVAAPTPHGKYFRIVDSCGHLGTGLAPATFDLGLLRRHFCNNKDCSRRPSSRARGPVSGGNAIARGPQHVLPPNDHQKARTYLRTTKAKGADGSVEPATNTNVASIASRGTETGSCYQRTSTSATTREIPTSPHEFGHGPTRTTRPATRRRAPRGGDGRPFAC